MQSLTMVCRLLHSVYCNFDLLFSTRAARTTIPVAIAHVHLELLYHARAASCTGSLALAHLSNPSAPTTSPVLSATLVSMAGSAITGPLPMLIQTDLASLLPAARALLATVAPSARPAVKH
jgi:hypothetical protein